MKDRTILWVFLAFSLGFALPVCSCIGTGFVTLSALGRMTGETMPTKLGVGDAVAMIRLDGAISSGPENYFSTQGITPSRAADLLELAAADPDIKAAIVQVNSPGGSVVASDQIYRMLLDFEKPVVIWMDEMAASGGYYISCGGDYVLLWNRITDEVYEGFVNIVAEARGLSVEEVRELADGRVYTGRQALQLGLVDAVGSPDDAIVKAAELGGIEGEPRVIELKPTPSFLDAFYSFQSRSTMPNLERILDWAGMPSLEYRFTGP